MISIKSKTEHGESEFGGGELEHDGGVGTPKKYTQKKARIVLGTIIPDGTGLKVDQLIKTNLRLEQNLAEAKSSANDTPITLGVQYLYTTGG